MLFGEHDLYIVWNIYFTPLQHTHTGASVVAILVHSIIMSVPDQTADEELGIVMEDVTIS